MPEMLELTGFKFCPSCGRTGLQNKDLKFCYCPSCGFVYCHNPAAAAAGIIEQDGNMLITVRSRDPQKGMLALPGGFVEYQESLEEALVREIREETNLKVKAVDYLCSYWGLYPYRGVNYFTTIAHFVIHAEDLAAAKAGDDAAQLLWLPTDTTVLDRFAFDCDRIAVMKFKTNQKFNRTISLNQQLSCTPSVYLHRSSK